MLGKAVDEPPEVSWDAALAGVAKESLQGKEEALTPASAAASKPRTLSGARWKAAGDLAHHLQ